MRRLGMRKTDSTIPAIAFLTLLSSAAQQLVALAVPEIDAGTAAIAIGLTVGIVALIREHRRKK